MIQNVTSIQVECKTLRLSSSVVAQHVVEMTGMAVFMIMLKYDKLYLAECHQSACRQLPACDAVYVRELEWGTPSPRDATQNFDRESPVNSRKLPTYIRQRGTIQAK